MEQIIIIFSGLPGSGKTTIARWLANEIDVSLLSIDDVVEIHARQIQIRDEDFWSQMIDILMCQVDDHLNSGESVIVDSVFMGADRSLARRLARKYAIDFFAIHTFCSDEELWRARVEKRRIEYPQDDPASWEQLIHQQEDFLPWNPADALFIDTANPLEENTPKVLNYISKAGRTTPP
jgi:predicted kinase